MWAPRDQVPRATCSGARSITRVRRAAGGHTVPGEKNQNIPVKDTGGAGDHTDEPHNHPSQPDPQTHTRTNARRARSRPSPRTEPRSRRTTNAHHARIAAPGLTQYQVLAPGGYSVIAAVRCPVLAPSVPRVMVNRRKCFEFRRRLGLHAKSQYRIRSASLKCRLRLGSC